jgi:diguanylate cyclase (GGDEF)-like protein
LSLQRRLTLFFVVIVIVPLAATGFVVHRIVVSEMAERASFELGPALDAVVSVYNERSGALEIRVRYAVGGDRFALALRSENQDRIDAYLEDALSASDKIDFLAVATGDTFVGFASQPAHFAPGFETPDAEETILTGPVGAGFVRTQIPLSVRGTETDYDLVGGFWLDAGFLQEVSRESVVLNVVAGDQIIASTSSFDGPQEMEIRTDRDFVTQLDEPVTARAQEIGDGVAFVAATPNARGGALSGQVLAWVAALFALALIATATLAYLLARIITRPLQELAEGAQAMAENRFGVQIAVRSRDEFGRLAIAFNDMSARLSETITQLQSSRDKLQMAIRRVGETLRSTHDLSQIRESIVNTASDAVGADAAVLWTFTPTRDELVPSVARGVDPDRLGRVQVGTGIVGLAAERALNVMVPSRRGGPRPAPGEPEFPAAIAAPIYTQDRVACVLVNYRRDAPFAEADLDTVRFLAEQGGVAIENVMLHEDAQRLSLTDGLTGVWNRRYFQMQFRQILATSMRFQRPFSILMLDLDRFKVVNDTYGHQTGDTILVEFARRVNETLREIDTFARYGGEEFVCLLSETALPGAMAAAEKILESIRDEEFGSSAGDQILLTVSIGVASYPEHGDSFRSLIGSADRALYRAKQEGRDCYRVADAATSGLRLA